MIFQTLRKPALALSLVTFGLPLTGGAAPIINGNFETGDFTGWNLDTDGFSGGSPDFQIKNIAGDNKAKIEADYWSTPGDFTSTPQDFVFFANTLYQDLDLTVAPGYDLMLSFDWEFSGQANTPDENFVVGLGDGTGNYYDQTGSLGFLLNPADYGSGTFSTILDPSFANALGWTLEFQLNAGFDALGSYVRLDNVSIEAVPQKASVPEPGILLLAGLGLGGLMASRKNKAASSVTENH